MLHALNLKIPVRSLNVLYMLEMCVFTALNTKIATLRNVKSYLSCSEISEEIVSLFLWNFTSFYQITSNHMPLDRNISYNVETYTSLKINNLIEN